MSKKKINHSEKENEKFKSEGDTKKGNIEYKLFDNMKYVLYIAWKEKKIVFYLFFIGAIMAAVANILIPFFNRYLVELIIGERSRKMLALICIGTLTAQKLAFFLNEATNFYIDTTGRYSLSCIYLRKLLIKQMETDYENLEKTYLNDTFSKAKGGASYVSSQAVECMSRTVRAIIQIITFGGILAFLNPLIILIVGIPTVVVYYINRHKMRWIWSDMTPGVTKIDRKIGYISSVSRDFSRAKDVRLFNMQKWFKKSYDDVFDERIAWWAKQDAWENKWDTLGIIVSTIGDFSAYLYTIFLVMKGRISSGEFILYFNSIMHLSASIRLWCDTISQYQWLSQNISYTREYLDIKEITNRGEGIKAPDKDCEIEFKHVSYMYQGANEPTIKDISFKLHKGEKLGLVGLNGAGKTTLIKLMCGLYDATEGEILLNGRLVNEYNREEYFDVFSAVFQDVSILPVTISQNITQNEHNDFNQEMVYEVLEKSGLYEKVMSLPDKEQTRLVKSVYNQATEFSGGQNQKLALAKALYKNSPILLLDEPTAALDPIAEQEMYMQYTEFSKGKSSVFISHRLASTRFCDRILLIENGRIEECGNHNELMINKGKYAELFTLQSSYYNQKKEEYDV